MFLPKRVFFVGRHFPSPPLQNTKPARIVDIELISSRHNAKIVIHQVVISRRKAQRVAAAIFFFLSKPMLANQNNGSGSASSCHFFLTSPKLGPLLLHRCTPRHIDAAICCVVVKVVIPVPYATNTVTCCILTRLSVVYRKLCVVFVLRVRARTC